MAAGEVRRKVEAAIKAQLETNPTVLEAEVFKDPAEGLVKMTANESIHMLFDGLRGLQDAVHILADEIDELRTTRG